MQRRETNRTSLKERASGVYDRRVENLPKRNICLSQFTQSFKYFYQAEDQLRVDLKFKSSILGVARRWLKKVHILTFLSFTLVCADRLYFHFGYVTAHVSL